MMRDGKVTLSRQVLRLDNGRHVYRRRRRTAGERAQELLFVYVLPVAIIVLLACCWVLLFWIGSAIERILRGEGI